MVRVSVLSAGLSRQLLLHGDCFHVLCCVSMPTYNPWGIGGISSGQDNKVILIKAAVEAHQFDSFPRWTQRNSIRNSTLSFLSTKHKCHTTTSFSGLGSSNIKSVDSWARSRPLLLVWQPHWGATDFDVGSLVGLDGIEKAFLMLSNIPYAPSICLVLQQSQIRWRCLSPIYQR